MDVYRAKGHSGSSPGFPKGHGFPPGPAQVTHPLGFLLLSTQSAGKTLSGNSEHQMRRHAKGSHRNKHAVRPQGTTASVQLRFVASMAVRAPGRRREPGKQTEHALAGPRGMDSPLHSAGSRLGEEALTR